MLYIVLSNSLNFACNLINRLRLLVHTAKQMKHIYIFNLIKSNKIAHFSASGR